MTEVRNSKRYDLEERTLEFTKKIYSYVQKISKTTANTEIAKQLVRSAGSVGANYIEANESLSRKDFIMRIKICRKEAKESRYWLSVLGEDKGPLFQEATELMKIFGSIVEKSK